MNEHSIIDIPGALYYLRLRGNGHSQLAASRADFAVLRQLLAHLVETTDAETRDSRLLGFCLFQDSLHILVRPGPQGILQLARWWVETHTQFLHRRARQQSAQYPSSQYQGPVYHKQVHAVLVDPNRYLLPLVQQLHWLPITEGLVATPSAYPRSSHRDYLQPDSPSWLSHEEVFNQVGNHRASQMRRFEHFMANPCQEFLDWNRGRHPNYLALADDAYIQSLIADNAIPIPVGAIDLDGLTEWLCSEYELEEKDLLLWRQHRLGGEVQAMIGALAKDFQIATVAEVADYFRTDEDVLRSGIRALSTRRGMYLYRLQSKLNQWLLDQNQAIDQFESHSAVTESEFTDEENEAADIPVLNTIHTESVHGYSTPSDQNS